MHFDFKNSILFFVFLLAILFILSFNKKIEAVNLAGQNIKVELATTIEEQHIGLSDRENLREDAGMLFVFSKAEQHHFWMKDMKFAIDIIWIDEDLNVVYIKENATPQDFPNTYGPDVACKYVLEVNAGFVEKYNLKVGDKVELIK